MKNQGHVVRDGNNAKVLNSDAFAAGYIDYVGNRPFDESWCRQVSLTRDRRHMFSPVTTGQNYERGRHFAAHMQATTGKVPVLYVGPRIRKTLLAELDACVAEGTII